MRLCKRDDIRDRVLARLDEEEGVLPAHGEIGKGRDRGDVVTSNKRGNGDSYLRRRLMRDHPEVYERVAAGELTAHAAAIAAGIKRKTVQVPAGDPVKAVGLLLRHYTREEILAALGEW